MNAEQIRAEAIEVLARTEWDAWKASFDLLDGGDAPPAPSYDDAPDDHIIKVGVLRQARRDVDALAVAGLLPIETQRLAAYAVLDTSDDHLVQRYLTDWRGVSE